MSAHTPDGWVSYTIYFRNDHSEAQGILTISAGTSEDCIHMARLNWDMLNEPKSGFTPISARP